MAEILGIGTGIKPTEKVPEKKEKDIDLSVLNLIEEDIIKILKQEINKLNGVLKRGGKSYTLTQIASVFEMSFEEFREYCQNHKNKRLIKLFIILQKLTLENDMYKSIEKGNIPKTVENWLKDAMNAYTNSGFQQVVNIIEKPVTEEFEIDQTIDRTKGDIYDTKEFIKKISDLENG